MKRRIATSLAFAALLASSAARAQELDATQLSKIPKQSRFVDAAYPDSAVAARLETDVVLLLDIDELGKVANVTVLEPSPHTGHGFDEAALAAARQFEFEPAEMDGRPVAVQLAYRYKFRLTLVPAPEPEPVPEPVPEKHDDPTPAAQRAPVVNFSGRLVERGTRAPLAGTLVTVFRDAASAEGGREGYEASTDDQGRFEFFDLAADRWKVHVEAPGYYPYRTAEDIGAGEAVDVTYYVERGSYNPFDVTVTAERPRKEVSRVALSREIMARVPGTAGDPIAVVQNLPSVARTGVGPFSGEIVVRGSAPEDTMVLVDGIDIPLLYHFGGLRSVFPLGMLGGIEFLPGNFASEYGRATGAIIDVEIKSPSSKRMTGYADVSILDTGVYLETPLGDKASLALGGRRSYLDVVLDAAVPADAPVSFTTAPVYYDYQALLTVRPSPAHELRLFVFGSDDRLELLFTNPADFTTEIDSNRIVNHSRFVRAAFRHRYVPSARFENTFSISAGTEHEYTSTGPLVLDLNYPSMQVREVARWKLSDALTVVAGGDALGYDASGYARLPPPPNEGEPDMGEPDFSETREAVIGEQILTASAHASLEWNPFEALLIVPGVRFDHFPRTSEQKLQPRLTARYQLPGQVALKGGVGLYHQEPPYYQTQDEYGNPDIESERAIHYSLGSEWRPAKHLLVDVTTFYKDLGNLVSPTDAIRMENGQARPLFYDNEGEGRVYGAELMVRHDFSSSFMGWLAYSASRSERIDSGKTEWRLFDYDQTHILTAVGSYKLWRNWEVSGRFRLVSGNPRTPVVGAVYDAPRDTYTAIYGAPNSERNGAFHQLDLRVDKRWVYRAWMLNLYLDVQNVYNRANPEELSYSYDFSQTKVSSGLPILTILGLKAEF